MRDATLNAMTRVLGVRLAQPLRCEAAAVAPFALTRTDLPIGVRAAALQIGLPVRRVGLAEVGGEVQTFW